MHPNTFAMKRLIYRGNCSRSRVLADGRRAGNPEIIIVYT